jgi:hypothetical protein
MKAPLAVLVAVALSAPAAASSSNAFDVALDATKQHESCLRLAKGESARYEWKSSAPLDFNIHYHQGNEVFYPVKKDGATSGKDTFKAPLEQDFCWMWTASRKAQLEGKVEK